MSEGLEIWLIISIGFALGLSIAILNLWPKRDPKTSEKIEIDRWALIQGMPSNVFCACGTKASISKVDWRKDHVAFTEFYCPKCITDDVIK